MVLQNIYIIRKNETLFFEPAQNLHPSTTPNGAV